MSPSTHRVVGYAICAAVLVMQVGVLASAGEGSDPYQAAPGTSILTFDDPGWGVGMEWRYAVEMSSFGGMNFTMSGNASLRINATQDITIGNTTYTTLRFNLWGSGSMKGDFGGMPITGTWFMQGRTNTLTNRTANVQTEMYTNISSSGVPPIRATNYMLMNWTPPVDPYDFPMDIGDKWMYAGVQEQYNWTYVQGMGYVDGPTHAVRNITTNYTVVTDEYRTVPAGTFYTYLVEASSMFLQLPNAGDEYYSDAAGNAVSIVIRDNTSRPVGYYNLTWTNYPPPAGKYGSIKGTVSDAQGPLPGANVTLSASGSAISSVVTDANGKYGFTYLTPGTYDLLANMSGYEDASVTGVKVDPGSTSTVDIIMKRPEGTITVNVRDAGGDPIADASVSLDGPVNLSGTTDPTGVFSKTVPKGDYTVTASRSGYKNASSSVSVSSGSTVQVNLTLEALPGGLKGRVLDAKGGTGIPNAEIVVYLSGSEVARTTSSSDGSYGLDLEPGSYEVRVSAPGYDELNITVTISPGQIRNMDFKLTPKGTSDGTPPPSQNVDMLWMALVPVLVAVVVLALIIILLRRRKGSTPPGTG